MLVRVGIAISNAVIFAALLFGPELGAQERTSRPIVRDVTPPGIVRVYGAPGRVDAKGIVGRRFDNIRVLADGKIRSKDVTIGLYGIVLPERDKLCVTSAGARWACGVSAIGALRNMIQTRMITCSVHDESDGYKDKVVGSCRLGHTDISLRLLEQGWATPNETVKEKHYLEAAEYGRNKGLGLWASGPTTTR